MTAHSLTWGRSYLMCPPEEFDVAYSINPWMDASVCVDRDVAMAQWQGVVEAIEAAGGRVQIMPAGPGLPDMVFTANAGVVDAGCFYAGPMLYPERAPEVDLASAWMLGAGFQVIRLPEATVQEGAGDALPFAGTLIAGLGQRSNRAAHEALRSYLSTPLLAVRLVDPRYYHIDLVFCPLDDRRAIVVPSMMDPVGARGVLDLIPEPLILDDSEAATFAMNSIVVDRKVIMPACPSRIGRQLERWGFDVVVAPVSEFIKAGGAVRCMSLPLDIDLSADHRAAQSAFGALPVAG